MGVVSLIFWSMTIVVSIKYVGLLMKADNKGQGGTLALVALISRFISRSRYGWIAVALGVFATALFYGDSMITPTVSVLSAVEGLTVVEARLQPLVIPISLTLLVGLFLIQKRGTAKVGALFAPDHADLFHRPRRSSACPYRPVARNPRRAQPVVRGALLLSTAPRRLPRARLGRARGDRLGGALFGHGPFRARADAAVMVRFRGCRALMLNYFGQGAMITGMDPAQSRPRRSRTPSSSSRPKHSRLPLVLLATSAASSLPARR